MHAQSCIEGVVVMGVVNVNGTRMLPCGVSVP